ncbi:hypothetical protein [Bradyrhizobium sp. UFLA05-112]
MTDRGWGRCFEGPIEIADRKLLTLRDAGEYIAALPPKVHDAPEWHAAAARKLVELARVSSRYRTVADNWRAGCSDPLCRTLHLPSHTFEKSSFLARARNLGKLRNTVH